MTPLGHVAVAVAVSGVAGRWGARLPLTPLVVGAVAPDLDVLLLPLESFNALHRVISHNVFFVVLVASLVASVRYRTWSSSLLSALLGGLLHLLVDAVMDNNPSNGMGVAWLWPASDQFLHPFNLVPRADHSAGWHAPMTQLRSLLPGLVWEVPFELYVVFSYRSAWRAAATRLRRWAARMLRRDALRPEER